MATEGQGAASTGKVVVAKRAARLRKASARLRRRGRRWWIALAAVAAVVLSFYLFVTLRGPRDYAGELARLLPTHTSACIAVNDFQGALDRIRDTRLYAQLRESVDLAALLLTNEDWREYQENKNSIEGKAKAALAREFLRRYFSKQMLVALARSEGGEEPALLVLARTDLGFAEKLAELCAALYPELRLTAERYRGIPLYVYEGKQSKRSFTYVRFGKTVALSLRSNKRDHLQRVIDYRLDGPSQTLFETDDFQQALRSPARRQGMLAVARPQALLEDLYARRDFRMTEHLAEARKARLERSLGPFRHGAIAVTVGQRIETRLVLRCNDSATSFFTLAPADRPLELLNTVPGNCMGFVDLRFGNLAETLALILNVHGAFSQEADDPEALGWAIEQLQADWGLEINRDLAPALGREAAVVIHDVKLPMLIAASLLIPVTDRGRAQRAIGRLAEATAERRSTGTVTLPEVPGFRPLYMTPLGFLGAGMLGDFCVWGLNPAGYLAAKEALEGRSNRSILHNEVFRALELPVGKPLDAVAFVNLEEIAGRAEGLLSVIALVSKSVRERWAKYSKIVAVAKLLRGAGLYVHHSREQWTVVLVVPTQ